MGEQPAVRISRDHADFERAFEVRWHVFVEEQGVPADEERDDLDNSAIHALIEIDGDVVATGRLTFDEGARIGRLAVLPAYRRRGLASLILHALEHEADMRGFQTVSLHAQTSAQPLYQKHGYAVSGPGFLEAGIDHVPMSKVL